MKENKKRKNDKQKRLAVSRESCIPLIPLEDYKDYKVVPRDLFSRRRNQTHYPQRKQQEV